MIMKRQYCIGMNDNRLAARPIRLALPWGGVTVLILALGLQFSSAQAPPTINYQTLHSFGLAEQWGAVPSRRLIEGSDGALYGTVEGDYGRSGAVFKLNKDGTGYTAIKIFTGSDGDGIWPRAPLLQGRDGSLYGTTYAGGSSGRGTVFKLNPDGTGYLMLWSFTSIGGDGYGPAGALVQGSDDALYGTTYGGGSSEGGTVFKLNPDGSGYMVLRSFTGVGGDGSYPWAGLVQGSDHALYGTTSEGGSSDRGTVFKLNLDGSGYAVLRSFTGIGGDGRWPHAPLLQGSDGALYGATYGGGITDLGTVFKLNLDGTGYTVLRAFTGYPDDGEHPLYDGLVQGSDGALYGTTGWGGSGYGGTVFKLNLDGTGYAVIKHLTGSLDDSSNPYSGLVQGSSDGALYGTTHGGGFANCGTVFKLNLDGTGYGIIWRFLEAGGDGESAQETLLLGSDGALYGTTAGGGSGNEGTVFKLNSDGTGYTVLKSFFGSDGAYPAGELVEGSDGALYGTTESGGNNSCGTVFKMNKNGSGFVVLKSFSGGSNGRYPQGLLEGSDNVLYGTAAGGGGAGCGIVFRLNKNASGFTVLRSFTGMGDANQPQAGLLEGGGGTLYGTTYYGGTSDKGAIFKLNKDGSGYLVLKSFTGTDGDGSHPQAALVQGSDGALYGTTPYGGNLDFAGGLGTLFKLNPDGTGYTVLRVLSYEDGVRPYGLSLIHI